MYNSVSHKVVLQQANYDEFLNKFCHIQIFLHLVQLEKLVYNLNTLPAKTVVKRSLEVNTELMNAEYDIPVERY